MFDSFYVNFLLNVAMGKMFSVSSVFVELLSIYLRKNYLRTFSTRYLRMFKVLTYFLFMLEFLHSMIYFPYLTYNPL